MVRLGSAVQLFVAVLFTQQIPGCAELCTEGTQPASDWQSLLQVNAPTHYKRARNASRYTEFMPRSARGLHINGMSSLILLTDAMSIVAARDFDPFNTSAGRVNFAWRKDVFPGSETSDEGLQFFNSASKKDWLILAIAAVVLFLLDLFVLQRLPDNPRSHALALCTWLAVALAFNAVIWANHGHSKALEWCSGYVLEWILSMDNLFVFHLVFETYKTPEAQVHKAVFIGIMGAVAIRMLFFMLVSTMLRFFTWVRFPFGLLLIWSGVQAARGGDDDMDVKDTLLVRGLKWMLGSRLREDYDGNCRLLVRDNHGRLQLTLLVLVVACLEFTDVVFALDSVSAKVAQIPNQYLAFSSSVIAMYGLRAMFFLVKDLVDMFELLQYGLCLILVFIGFELMFARFVHLASSTVCFLIVSVFFICIAGSIARRRLAFVTAQKNSSETASEGS
mmetsp:Transcript_28031/g.65468  ORF Transcript_28031/g.65468 Transcript_28031/m.65468 type:complete len:447 (+) Transcript_28031:54-1394(+)